MRFNKLDLNLLVALDAMLSEQSISRAAERLHMSQSATSNALARLREYFDDELLVQVGRRMELTPRAEVLREAVHDVLLRIDTSVAARPVFDPRHTDREFRLFVSDFTLATLMPYALVRASAEGATARFRLLAQVDDPQRALDRGEIDLLVVPTDFHSPNHPTATLFKENFACVVWDAGRYAEGISFEQYAQASHVVVHVMNSPQPSFESWFVQRYGLARRDEVFTFSFTSAPPLVVGTDRIATVHSRLARQAARYLPLRIHPPPLAIPEMSQGMQWHRYRSNDPGMVWLCDLMKRAAEDMDKVEPALG